MGRGAENEQLDPILVEWNGIADQISPHDLAAGGLQSEYLTRRYIDTIPRHLTLPDPVVRTSIL